MLRHLKNATELTLYASVSCGLAFIARLLPSFHFPIVLLRLAILAYCVYVIAGTEKNKELAVILGASLFLGMIGGYWDLIEIWLRFDSQRIISILSVVFLVLLSIPAIVLQVKYGQTSKK